LEVPNQHFVLLALIKMQLAMVHAKFARRDLRVVSTQVYLIAVQQVLIARKEQNFRLNTCVRRALSMNMQIWIICHLVYHAVLECTAAHQA
jgi:hypothetical protein